MKVTEVYFKRNYAISPLTMEHMHLATTVVIEENESAEEAFLLAKKTVEDFYNKSMGEILNAFSPSVYPNFDNVEDLPAIDYKKLEQIEIEKDNKIN